MLRSTNNNFGSNNDLTLSQHRQMKIKNKVKCREGYECFSVKIRPRDALSTSTPEIVACSMGTQFGMRGPGAVSLLHVYPGKIEATTQSFNTHEAAFDCSWSHIPGMSSLLAVGLANGEIGVLREDRGTLMGFNFQQGWMRLHRAEVWSVDWSPITINPGFLLTASWDHQARVINLMNNSFSSGVTLNHEWPLNQATWSPLYPDTLMTIGRQTLVWDLSVRIDKPVLAINASPRNENTADSLTGQWNPQLSWQIALADRHEISLWDLRNPGNPYLRLYPGHRRSVRRLAFNPYNPTLLGTVSLDMSVKVWDTRTGSSRPWVCDQFTEFVYDLDWFSSRELLVCGWDDHVTQLSLDL